MTGDRIVSAREHGDPRTVAGVKVQVWELIWRSGGRSYDVTVNTGENQEDQNELTTEESFDTVPTDEQITDLLVQYIGFWCCQGCGASYHIYEADRILDHTKNCDLGRFHAEVMHQTA